MITKSEALEWVERRNSLIGAIKSTTSSKLVVTFDDGPDPELTPKMMDVLAKHGASATFFVLLTKVRRNPSLLADILDAGHEVGLHGPDHRALTDFAHREAIARTVRARQELEDAVGTEIRWFRPPYGSQSVSSLIATGRAGMTSVLWSATTWDWKQVSHGERLSKAAQGGRPGAILLAHDGIVGAADGAEDEPAVACDRAALMDEILGEYGARGLDCTSLGDALTSGRAVRTVRVTTRPNTAAPAS